MLYELFIEFGRETTFGDNLLHQITVSKANLSHYVQ